MSQYEQENDLGEGGGEVDDATMEKARQDAAERRSTANIDEDASDAEGPQPWAKASSGDAGEI